MADVSDPIIRETYEEVRDDRNDTNWLILQYENDKSDKLVLAAKGPGGLEEFTEQLSPDQAAFGYLRMNVSNDELSVRTKFVFVTWIGSKVKILRKAKLSVHVSDVKSVLNAYAIETTAHDNNDLIESEILTQLRKAGGANYDSGSHNY
ncbi:3072_t:CDS:2 [Paraglomus brasilianum]|uniref:3072_t:CDS:1 n=1 Tax=Paraglomus brasilianum TaxID=144538 RepID=A0A9N8WTB0_9GLOM|nr:3072_t:CDS:2 [Paraglomus brasilianum]